MGVVFEPPLASGTFRGLTKQFPLVRALLTLLLPLLLTLLLLLFAFCDESDFEWKSKAEGEEQKGLGG